MIDNNELSRHILPTSAQLVGVCITVISLIKALHLGQAGRVLDVLLAINSILFTISTLLSYMSIRGYKSEKFERYADQFFMLGLVELGMSAALLSLELI